MSVWEVFLAAIGACGTVCAIIFGYQAISETAKVTTKTRARKTVLF